MLRVKTLTALLAVGLAAAGCGQGISGKSCFVLAEGDLLFQDLDCGRLCDAIEKVTTGYGGANFSHVGIVARDGTGELVVIEAVSAGVALTPLDSFLGRSLDPAAKPKVAVGRLKRRFRHLIPPAIRHARTLQGRAYDKQFVIGNEKYYCSELIYEIFLQANEGRPVFELEPMTFNDPYTAALLPAWQEYFDELGIAAPQGRGGINPGGISRSPAINIIHAYGTCGGGASQ